MNYFDFARKILFYSQDEEPRDEVRIYIPEDEMGFQIFGLDEIDWGDGTVDDLDHHTYALAGAGSALRKDPRTERTRG